MNGLGCLAPLLTLFALGVFVITLIIAIVFVVRRRAKTIYPIVALLPVVAGVYMCDVGRQRVMNELRTLHRYDPNDSAQSSYFYVIGFAKDQPQFVPLVDLDRKMREEGIETFYIDAKLLPDIPRRLKEKPMYAELEELKLLRDDPKQRKQRVYLRVQSDEFEYSSVYDAWDDHVEPIQYADITMREVTDSSHAHYAWPFTGIIVGVILNILAIRPTKTPSVAA